MLNFNDTYKKNNIICRYNIIIMSKRWCGAKKAPAGYSSKTGYKQCEEAKQLRKYGVKAIPKAAAAKLMKKKGRTPAKALRARKAEKHAIQNEVYDEAIKAEEEQEMAQEEYEIAKEQLNKAKEDLDAAKEVVGQGLRRKRRGGTIGKSHSSYDYDGMWAQMGSGARSGGRRKKAGSYSGGYVEDIHEMDIHHG